MKKVVGIFFAVVMVFVFASIAFADEEVTSFCSEHFYLNKFISENGEHYNVIGNDAYGIGEFGDYFGTMEDFMDKYVSEYLSDMWPEFAKDVEVEYYTLTIASEHYEYLIVELKLNNGKLMNDYVSYEPAVSRIVGLVPFTKTDK